ncbi:transcriptional regulator [Bacteroides thetaiotaomicron]|nr:transcriptional regulator [Bacteroides thetaiotaomicron]
MDAIILQENIEGLLSLVRMLLPGGGSAGCVYLDDLSALQRSIHEKINDLYSQRGETPEQDATLCLAILQGYNVSMYANPEDEDRKRSVLQRSLTLLDAEENE